MASSNCARRTRPETKGATGHVAEQIRTTVGDLAQLRDGGVNVQRVSAGVR
jgi:hypothetical protein